MSLIEGAQTPSPRRPVERLETLDVLRGVALLGILLMNILGFGLHSAGYFNPQVGADPGVLGHRIDMGLWVAFELTVEGAMRGLFSMLFGASLLLFTTGATAKPGALHYRRQVWLLLFGLINGFILLWPGDVLWTYALCGMLLYPLRAASDRRLLVVAVVLLLIVVLVGALSAFGLNMLRAEAADSDAAAIEWTEFAATMRPDAQAYAEELAIRKSGYLTVAAWNVGVMAETLLFVVPVFMLWDALLMMVIGMLLLRWGVLSGARPRRDYWQLLVWGGVIGFAINGYEVWSRVQSGYDALSLFSYFWPTYHLGRLAVALAWVGAIILACQAAASWAWWQSLQARLAAVGRTALTNYLLQSVFGLLLFTGAGLGLVGDLYRWQLYLVVAVIWVVQLWWSPRWLAAFRFGPMEWLWRWLTYGQRPALRRADSQMAMQSSRRG